MLPSLPLIVLHRVLAQEHGGLGWRSKPVLYQRDGDDVMLACFYFVINGIYKVFDQKSQPNVNQLFEVIRQRHSR